MKVKISILYMCLLACLFISCGDDTDTEPPSAPSGLAVRVDSDGILLTWVANHEEDLAGYNVYFSEEDIYYKVNSELIDKSNHPSYRDPRAFELTDEHYYVVTAVDEAGNESEDSAKAYMITQEGYLYFDGNDYVEIQDTPKLSGGPGKSLTIELWVRPLSYGDEERRCMISKYVGWNTKEWGVFIEIDGKDKAQIDGAIAFQKETWSMPGTPHGNWYTWSSEAIPLGQWTHVAAVFDNNQDVVSIYINGMLSGSKDLTGDLPDTGAAVWIGGPGNFYYSQYGRETFHGHIDDVRIWSIARRENHIRNDMWVGRISGDEPGLVAYWDFERDSDNQSVLYDQTENGHDGDIVGAVWEDEDPPPSMPQ